MPKRKLIFVNLIIAITGVVLFPSLSYGAGWTELPNTSLSTIHYTDPDLNAYPQHNYTQLLPSWSGGIADTSRNLLLYWGGGHTSYFGNEIYYINPVSSTAGILKNPTIISDWSNYSLSNCPYWKMSDPDYSDSTGGVAPTSKHTYDQIVYDSDRDKIYTFGGGGFCEAGGSWQDAWSFSPTINKWTLITDNLAALSPGYSGQYHGQATYDPWTRKVYIISEIGEVRSYDPDTNQFSLINGVLDPGRDAYRLTSTLDSLRHRIVIVGNGRIVVYSLPSGIRTDYTSTFSSCSSYFAPPAPGTAYDPVLDKVVIWPSVGNSVALLNFNDNTCTTITPAGIGPGAATYVDGTNSVNNNGTFGRFRYLPALNKYILVTQNPHQNAFLLELSSTPADTTPPAAPSGLSIS